MKRWTLRITVCLILGAVTTYLISWMCLRSRLNHGPDFPGSQATPLLQEFYGPNIRGFRGWHSQGFFVWQTTVVGGIRTEILRVDRTVAITTAGLPLPAVRGWRVDDETVGGIEVPSSWSPRNSALKGLGILPVWPVFPGILINSIVYAAIWLVVGRWLIAEWRIVHAKLIVRRTRRGRCPRCGYDLRGEFKDGCSECGWGRGN